MTELVHGALELPSAQRRAWIDRQANGDPELAAEVWRLVESHEVAGGFLDVPLLQQRSAAAAVSEALADGQPMLSPGQRIGSFVVLDPLGAGGMGEVWRAHDPALGRDVAIKVLPSTFSCDADRLRRFEQEARAAGQINHPNILTVHAVGTDAGRPYLVTELLEGETLKQRLVTGALPSRKAVDLARQIALGLGAAHERGIVHRDLKPANLFITTDGRLKILDFGLAKLLESAAAEGGSAVSASGVLVGTVGYMAPEQVRGQAVDHRADLFALGVVLYESISGRRAFGGESSVEVMHQILTSEPPPLEGVDPVLVRTIQHCLEKQPGERFQSARDLAFQLDAALPSSRARLQPDATPPMPRGPFAAARVHAWLPWAVAVAMACVAIVAVVGRRDVPVSSEQLGVPRRFSFSLATAPLHVEEWPSVAISPNGARIAYVVRDAQGARIIVRDLEAATERAVPGTENGFAAFFSPDGEQLGFFTSQALMRVSLVGGPPVRIREVSSVSRGAVWTNDGRIYLAHTQSMGISSIGADGADAKRVTTLDSASDDQGHLWPDVAPDGSVLVYVARRGGSMDDARIVARSLRSGLQRTLVEGGTFPRFASQTQLVFTRGDTLHLLDIDPVSLIPRGSPRPILRGVQSDTLFGVSHYAVARDGTLVFAPGDARPPGRTLLWVTPAGAEELAFPNEGTFVYPAISPDGKSVVVTTDGSNQDLWRFEVGRPVLSRLTSHPSEDFGAVWSPDGRRLAYTSVRDAQSPAVFVKPADSIDGEVSVARSFANAWTGTGNGVVVTTEQYDGRSPSLELSVATLDGASTDTIVPSRYDRYAATLSPDGRHLAFVSLETGRPEVFVARPDASLPRQASVGGGTSPVWSRDSQRLFYRRADDVMAVAVGRGVPPALSLPVRLFSGRFMEPGRPDWPRNYDVGPDGRFLMIRQTYTPAVRELVVVVGWRGQAPITRAP